MLFSTELRGRASRKPGRKSLLVRSGRVGLRKSRSLQARRTFGRIDFVGLGAWREKGSGSDWRSGLAQAAALTGSRERQRANVSAFTSLAWPRRSTI